MKHRAMLAAVFGFLAFATTASAQVNLIQNGSFETNGGVATSTFANWTATDLAGGTGSWFVQTGTGSPLNGFGVPVPTNGSFAAMTDQGGPGTHALIQSFIVPAGGVASATLSFDWMVNNQAGAFAINGAGLDHTASPNQHARVDILTGSATTFSTAAVDVLLNAFITNVGDAAVSGYNTASIDVTALLNSQAGNTLQIRFAEVDNQLFFNFGVDNVQLLVAVPEPATIALMSLGVIGSAGFVYLRKRKNKLALEGKLVR